MSFKPCLDSSDDKPLDGASFKIAKYDPCDRQGWNEVQDIEDALRILVEFIREKGINVVILPGPETRPLRTALNILVPEAKIILDERVVKIRTEEEAVDILQDNPEIMGLRNQRDRQILCLDDAVQSGRTLFVMRKALKFLIDVDIHAGALFLVNDGRDMKDQYRDSYLYGKVIRQNRAPSWYFVMQEPDADSFDSPEDVLERACEEMEMISERLLPDGWKSSGCRAPG